MQEYIKIEIGRMLLEGVSEEGIRAVVKDMEEHPWLYPTHDDMSDALHYAAFVEYGYPPIDEVKTVESTIEKKRVTYHWIDATGQPRVTAEDDDMEELQTYIEQCRLKPTGYPIYVHQFIEGSIVTPITDEGHLLK
jgi:hypothetical protein